MLKNNVVVVVVGGWVVVIWKLFVNCEQLTNLRQSQDMKIKVDVE